MGVYKIEVSGELNKILEEGAALSDVSVEVFIERVLSRFAIDPHVLDGDDVKKGYVETGDVNLEISNQ